MDLNMLTDCKITRVENAAAAAQTEVVTDVLDNEGFDGVLYIVAAGEVTDGSVVTCTAKENTANSTSSPTPTAVTGGATAAHTAASNDADNKLFVVDVRRPTKRYQFLSVTRTTQNAVIDSIVAIQYRARSLPVTQGSTIVKSASSTPMV